MMYSQCPFSAGLQITDQYSCLYFCFVAIFGPAKINVEFCTVNGFKYGVVSLQWSVLILLVGVQLLNCDRYDTFQHHVPFTGESVILCLFIISTRKRLGFLNCWIHHDFCHVSTYASCRNSVRPSICLSHACFVTKPNNALRIF